MADLCKGGTNGSYCVCPSKLIYHIPCPGCGTTRATILMLKGDILPALHLNPNSLLAVGYLFSYPFILGIDICTKKRGLWQAYCWLDTFVKQKVVFIVLIFIEACIWIHNIVADI